jgi:hypothetical protein
MPVWNRFTETSEEAFEREYMQWAVDMNFFSFVSPIPCPSALADTENAIFSLKTKLPRYPFKVGVDLPVFVSKLTSVTLSC